MSTLSNLSSRERNLIGLAGGLFALFAVWQFGIKPILDDRERAAQAQSSALRDMDIVRRGLPKIAGSQQVGARAAFDRAAAIGAANRLNLDIARTQPAPDGGLQIWFENAQSAEIYRFVTELSASHDVGIRRVQITARKTGTVSAQVTLAPVP